MFDYKKLTKDITAAREAAEAFENVDDGGTCNFDCALLCIKGVEPQKVVAACERAGVSCYNSSFCSPGIFMLGGVSGLGFRRTAMAEAMRDSLKAAGYTAYVYYQID